MDENACNKKLKAVKIAFSIVDRRIRFLNPENISLEDKDTYKKYLEETRKHRPGDLKVERRKGEEEGSVQ